MHMQDSFMSKEPRAHDVIDCSNRVDVDDIASAEAGNRPRQGRRQSEQALHQQSAQVPLARHPQRRDHDVIRDRLQQVGNWATARNQHLDMGRRKQAAYRGHRIDEAAIRSVKLVMGVHAENPHGAFPIFVSRISGAHRLARRSLSCPTGAQV